MPDYLGAIGVLFFMFFLVAAATEAVLEAFRGLLERIGITFLKSSVSLDDAIQRATEYLPDGSQTLGKVAALQEIVAKAPKAVAVKAEELAAVRADLARLVPGQIIENELIARVNVVAMHIREAFDTDERRRVFILRAISGLIAIGLSWYAEVDALRAMVQAYPALFKGLLTFYDLRPAGGAMEAVPNSIVGQYVGVVVTGVAAASGSSYWHDALDKVRNLKNLTEKAKRLGTP